MLYSSDGRAAVVKREQQRRTSKGCWKFELQLLNGRIRWKCFNGASQIGALAESANCAWLKPFLPASSKVLSLLSLPVRRERERERDGSFNIMVFKGYNLTVRWSGRKTFHNLCGLSKVTLKWQLSFEIDRNSPQRRPTSLTVQTQLEPSSSFLSPVRSLSSVRSAFWPVKPDSSNRNPAPVLRLSSGSLNWWRREGKPINSRAFNNRRF